MKKILFCLLAFYTPVSIIIAQNTTNSPTSMFGLGELSTGEGGQYAGLGGAGIALRGNNFLNSANPASLTELTERLLAPRCRYHGSIPDLFATRSKQPFRHRKSE